MLKKDLAQPFLYLFIQKHFHRLRYVRLQPIRCYFLCLRSEVVGRVTSLSPLKSQKSNSSSSFFDTDIITSIGSERAVCFDKRRYDLFQELNDSPTHGISIERPRQSENDDIIITDFSKTIKVKEDQIAVQQLEITPINEALSEKGTFE